MYIISENVSNLIWLDVIPLGSIFCSIYCVSENWKRFKFYVKLFFVIFEHNEICKTITCWLIQNFMCSVPDPVLPMDMQKLFLTYFEAKLL
jgi:hypothetical protein